MDKHDGKQFFVIEDKSQAQTDLSHDLVVREEGVKARFIRISDMEIPYGQKPSISGLRIFGIGDGKIPNKAVYSAVRDTRIDMNVKIEHGDGALGHMILWGSSPEKLYHSWMVLGDEAVTEPKRVGALVADRDYYVRVDSFNENGITTGDVQKLI